MNDSRRTRMIAIGYNTHGTGLTRVMCELLRSLSARFDIHFLGIGYAGPFKDDGVKWYPTNERGGDVFAQFQAEELIKTIKPEIVFILHDLWLFEQYMRCLGPYRDRVKLVAYIPIDGNITDEQLLAPLYEAHAVVAYTAWAQREFQQAFSRLPEGPKSAPLVCAIGHATDITQFRPAPELLAENFHHRGRATAKRSVLQEPSPGASGLLAPVDEAFVVLNAARPSERKRIDLTLEGFAKFARGKSDVLLCLHHSYTTEAIDQELAGQASRLGIQHQLLFNPLGGEGGAVSDERLNRLYAACDVGLNTSMGEGWGLVSFEHAAAGAAQIVPNHSACGELWQGHAILLEPMRSFVPSFSLLELAEVSASSVAEALERLYRDRQYLQKMSAAAYQHATEQAAGGWSDVAQEFAELFTQLCAG